MKRQLATEWLIEHIMDMIHESNHPELANIYEQVKQKELDNLDKSYAHGSLSLLDTGHGDTFEQYIKETYGVDK